MALTLRPWRSLHRSQGCHARPLPFFIPTPIWALQPPHPAPDRQLRRQVLATAAAAEPGEAPAPAASSINVSSSEGSPSSSPSSSTASRSARSSSSSSSGAAARPPPVTVSRALGVDYGRRLIGLAVSTLGLAPRTLPPMPGGRASDVPELARQVVERARNEGESIVL